MGPGPQAPYPPSAGYPTSTPPYGNGPPSQQPYNNGPPPPYYSSPPPGPLPEDLPPPRPGRPPPYGVPAADAAPGTNNQTFAAAPPSSYQGVVTGFPKI